MRMQVSSNRMVMHPSFRGNFGARLHRRYVTLKVRVTRYAGMGMGTPLARELAGFSAVLWTGAMSGLHKVIHWLWKAFHALLYVILWCCIPGEKVWSFIKKLVVNLSEVIVRHTINANKRANGRLVPIAFLGCVTVLIISATYFGVGLEVTINGVSVGYVGSRQQVESMISDVEHKVSEYMGTPYHFALNIDYKLRYMDRGNMLNSTKVRELLMSSVSGISTQYVLTVDGQVIGANSSKIALELLKHRLLQSRSTPEANVKTELVQDVEIVERPVANSQIKTVEEIEQLLNANTQQMIVYKVKSGDTVSGIAKQFGMSVKDIQNLNPQIKIDKIGIGDELQISAAVPFLSVKQTKRLEYSQEIPYEVITKAADDLYTTQSRIVKKGVAGEAQIVSDVVYVNGQEQSRTITNYEVILQPQAQIKEVGTIAPPAKAPKGTFILPFNGLRTSTYGYRPSMGDFHTGIDLAGATGSAIVAADGGTVTFAGWNGNYGYCIIITHGNSGFATLYGHCSKLLVKQGQKVAQGEQIAKVGSTGRTTGPHLHFEVRIGGKTVNPLQYIGKTYCSNPNG